MLLGGSLRVPAGANLAFPWGNEDYPFSSRGWGYLKWFQKLPPLKKNYYLNRLLGYKNHLTRGMHQCR